MVNCAENMVNFVLPLYGKETIRYNKIWKSVHEEGTFWFVIQKYWVKKQDYNLHERVDDL